MFPCCWDYYSFHHAAIRSDHVKTVLGDARAAGRIFSDSQASVRKPGYDDSAPNVSTRMGLLDTVVRVVVCHDPSSHSPFSPHRRYRPGMARVIVGVSDVHGLFVRRNGRRQDKAGLCT